jgi:hypothetical protein
MDLTHARGEQTAQNCHQQQSFTEPHRFFLPVSKHPIMFKDADPSTGG